MMQEVEVLKTIQELICSFFSEEQFTVSVFSILTRDALLGKIGAILSDNIGLSFNPDRYCYIVYINNIFKKWS